MILSPHACMWLSIQNTHIVIVSQHTAGLLNSSTGQVSLSGLVQLFLISFCSLFREHKPSPPSWYFPGVCRHKSLDKIFVSLCLLLHGVLNRASMDSFLLFGRQPRSSQTVLELHRVCEHMLHRMATCQHYYIIVHGCHGTSQSYTMPISGIYHEYIAIINKPRSVPGRHGITIILLITVHDMT